MPIIKTDKKSIIKVSIHLFKVNGYSSTTMATIGKACGLMKGSIYHHFNSKEELALACLKYIHEYFKNDIFSIAYRQDLSPKDKLILFTKKVNAYFMKSDGGCLLGNFALEISNTNPLLKDEIITYFQSWEAALECILIPDLGKERAKAQANQIVSATQGSILLMRLYNDPTPFTIQNDTIVKLLP